MKELCIFKKAVTKEQIKYKMLLRQIQLCTLLFWNNNHPDVAFDMNPAAL